MKLKTIAAATLSLASLIATAQTLDLNFIGSTNTGSFTGQSIFLNDSSGVGGTILFDNAGPALNTLNTTFTFNNLAVPPVGTFPVLPGVLTSEFGLPQADGYSYSFLFVKVSNQTPGTTTAGLNLNLSLTDNGAPGTYSFLNGLTTLSLDNTMNQFWRGFSATTANPALTGNDVVFQTLLTGPVGSTLDAVTGLPTYVTTNQPSGNQVDAIFATVIRVTGL